MAAVKELIDTVTDADTANAAAPKLKDITHALTSARESTIMWNAHIKSLNLFFDKVLKAYAPMPEETEEK